MTVSNLWEAVFMQIFKLHAVFWECLTSVNYEQLAFRSYLSSSIDAYLTWPLGRHIYYFFFYPKRLLKWRTDLLYKEVNRLIKSWIDAEQKMQLLYIITSSPVDIIDGIQQVLIDLSKRTLWTSHILRKEMYWNDKANANETVSYCSSCYFIYIIRVGRQKSTSGCIMHVYTHIYI